MEHTVHYQFLQMHILINVASSIASISEAENAEVYIPLTPKLLKIRTNVRNECGKMDDRL